MFTLCSGTRDRCVLWCMSLQVWRQQNSQRWYDNPLIAQDCMMLSADCTDLLNKIFKLDQTQRSVRENPATARDSRRACCNRGCGCKRLWHVPHGQQCRT